MYLPAMKQPAKAQIEASARNKAEREVRIDIQKIDNALKDADPHEMEELHRYLDGKYQYCVANWGNSMYGYIAGHGFKYDFLDPGSIKDNLSTMKPKLEAFIYGWNTTASPGYARSSDVNVTVNNTNTVNISVSFEEARKQVEDMSSLTDEQTQEVLERIDEIERVINTDASKKTKWEKIKPVLVWLADKSYDLGKTILPLLLKIQE